MTKSAFVFTKNLLNYKFNDTHPFNPIRLEMTIDLLKNLGALNEDAFIEPDEENEDLLTLFHDPAYIDAVKKSSLGLLTEDEASPFGLGTEDTPIFKGMHEASLSIVSSTVKACDLVGKNQVSHALNLGGGLHHGFSGKASGFCVYNDIAVAIKYLTKTFGLRVLYIDTDAHHGDGVQWGFYDDPSVCTFSIHETGRYLFPGTGYVHERGVGSGHGFSFNLPIDAFTEDESWLHVFETSIKAVAEFFKPDIILSQHGADAHYYDPLTHLNLSMHSYQRIPEIIHQLSHDFCDGKWVAVGGGGYDLWRVVPRAWSLIWLVMNDYKITEHALPTDFISKWQGLSPKKLPVKWEDPVDMYSPIPRKKEITDINNITLQKLLQGIQIQSKFL